MEDQQQEATTSERQATVLNIQRMSTEDGPGIRTTVFLKGCSLVCAWCHNPEALAAKAQLVWHDWKCIACNTCQSVCEEDALSANGEGIAIDRELCNVCGRCAEECPALALEMLGTVWELDDLVTEVVKDKSYFETSGGGITVSGGEPVLQAPFVEPFIRRCGELGLHTALDTCGMCSAGALEKLCGHTDLLLYDLKEVDPQRHARFTGYSNEKILENLLSLGERVRKQGRPSELWIRTPLIPGATANEETIRAIGGFLAEKLDGVIDRWELCAFNNLATDKYRRLDMSWQYADTPLMSAQELREFEQVARGSGVNPDIVAATGPVAVEREDTRQAEASP